MVEIRSGTYSKFSNADIAAFKRLVQSEGRVTEATLPGLMKRAAKLVLLTNGDQIIGTAAIKTPNFKYRQSVFRKAKVTGLEGTYESELGWVVVAPSHRGNGHSRRLVEQAIASLEKGIYATSQREDEAMHHTLENVGFKKTGSPYPSAKNSDRNVFLFLKQS
jgi:predicted GNAT family N-acyltransferase